MSPPSRGKTLALLILESGMEKKLSDAGKTRIIPLRDMGGFTTVEKTTRESYTWGESIKILGGVEGSNM